MAEQIESNFEKKPEGDKKEVEAEALERLIADMKKKPEYKNFSEDDLRLVAKHSLRPPKKLPGYNPHGDRYLD